MLSPTYYPQAHTLAAQLCAYLATSPSGTAISTEAIADQFSVPYKNIHTQLASSVEAGLLRRTQDAEHGYLYSPTPALRERHRPSGTPPTATARAASQPELGTGKKPGQRNRRMVDLAALPIDTHVPLPAGKNRAHYDYGAVLDRLAKPGYSFLVPAGAAGLHPLRKAMSARKKAGNAIYVERKESNGDLRIWRSA